MQNSTQIKEELTSVEGRLTELGTALESHARAFGAAIVQQAERWITDEVRERVRANASKVSSMPEEQLSALKSDVADVIGRLPDLAATAVTQTAWPHRPTATQSTPTRVSTAGGEGPFAATFRHVISNLGRILIAYNILDDEPGRIASWKREGAHARFAIDPGFDGRQYSSVQHYELLLQDFERETKRANELRNELVKAKALERFDSA